MSYSNNIIMTLGVDDESTYGRKLGITVAVDTLGMCTISFGTSYSVRIPEDDVDALRGVLNTAAIMLMNQRIEAREYEEATLHAEEEMATEADDYDPEDDWSLAEGRPAHMRDEDWD